jgi:sugar lactone lactonase YvrE
MESFIISARCKTFLSILDLYSLMKFPCTFKLMHSRIWILAFFLCTSSINIALSQPSQNVPLENPSGIAVDKEGNVYVAERRANRIIKIDTAGIVITLAGTGKRGFSGDGGPAQRAEIAVPETMVIDKKGNLIFCDRSNSRIRMVSKGGTVSTVAGNGVPGYSGDGGLAVNANISYPYGLAIDDSNNLYIADTDNHRIRRVDASTGNITTIAGNGEMGFDGDGQQALQAKFNRPHVIAFDNEGDLLIGDSFNQRIRKIDMKTGGIQTIAGTGEQRTSGDGELAIKASFNFFGALVVDKASGDIYITGGDHRIRRIDKRSGKIFTYSGDGSAGDNGTNQSATQYKFNGPYGMAMTPNWIYVVDTGNQRVIRINRESLQTSLVIGKR